jgi:DNA-binding NarL/FixJ family response regulator
VEQNRELDHQLPVVAVVATALVADAVAASLKSLPAVVVTVTDPSGALPPPSLQPQVVVADFSAPHATSIVSAWTQRTPTPRIIVFDDRETPSTFHQQLPETHLLKVSDPSELFSLVAEVCSGF